MGGDEQDNYDLLVLLSRDRPKSWLRWLPWAEHCYNTSFQTVLKATPFEVIYGHAPPALLPALPGSTRVEVVDQQHLERVIFLAEVFSKRKAS
jgi:hypothetical protein